MLRVRRLAVLAFCVLPLSGLRAAAQPTGGLCTLEFAAAPLAGGPGGAAVTVNGARLMTLREPGGVALAAARTIAARLQMLALQGVGPENVEVRAQRGGYALVIAERWVVSIDARRAAAASSTREALAQQWAAGLRQALAGPYVAVPVSALVVPYAETRALAVRGQWKRLTVGADTAVLTAGWQESTRMLSLRGVAASQTQVVFDAGGARLTLPVRVMKYAGRLAAQAEATVTGVTAPAWAIKKAAAAAVYLSIAPEPGAWAEIGSVVADKPAIAPGNSAVATVNVTIRGDGYLPVRANSRVRVMNEAIPPVDAKMLMVSNRPERLPALGVWYEGSILEDHPVRLLFHHVNATGADAELAVELVNPSGHPVRAQIVEASGGPSDDEVFAGHKATRDFIERQSGDVGYIASLPDGCAYTVASMPMKPGQIASGLAEIRVFDQGQLRVRVRLRAPTADLVTPVPQPTERLSTWVFADPHREIDTAYRVGDAWAFATIGDQRALSATGREVLDGDYGVFYNVQFALENPTAAPAAVELAVMPGGGTARATLIVDGRIYETGLLRYGRTDRVCGWGLGVGERRKVSVRIMPQAGSNYPLKLVMRPDTARRQ